MDEGPGEDRVTCAGETRNGYTFLSEILQERDHLEGLCRWENNLKIDLTEIGWGSVRDSEEGPVADSSGHGNECVGSTKDETFLD